MVTFLKLHPPHLHVLQGRTRRPWTPQLLAIFPLLEKDKHHTCLPPLTNVCFVEQPQHPQCPHSFMSPIQEDQYHLVKSAHPTHYFQEQEAELNLLTYKNMQNIKQNQDTEEYVINERTEQKHSKRPK